MKFSQQVLLIILLPLFALGQKDSIIEANPFLQDRLMIKAGLFVPSRNVALGADGSIINDLIDFDETFNFTDNESTFFMQVNWKFSRNRKWMLSAEYFSVNNGNSATLDEDLEFEDITFEKGTFVRAGIEFALYRVFFSYELISKPRHNLGVGLGSHLFNVGAFIEGDVRTSEGNLEFERSRVSALVPLPNVGAHYYFGPHPKWAFGARVDWFGLSVGDYSGSLWNVAPQVNFQIFRNFGIGLDYRFFFVNAKVSQENWNGRFEMDFSGPLFTLHGNF
jgi:hypothetical protein